MTEGSGIFDASAVADSTQGDELPVVPLFPLPNVVLLPGAVLPLHIFEERYKTMTRHALEGDRRIAMALLRPGWEKCYHGRPAIEPVVCVGTILSAEELPDGKFNFLLQGTLRATIIAEVGTEPYRLARIRALEQVQPEPGLMRKRRQQLLDLFTSPRVAGTVMGRQFTRILSTAMCTDEIADLAAFTFIEEASIKQKLLADGNVARRVSTVVELLERAVGVFGPASTATQVAAMAGSYRNPSMN